MAGRAYEPDLIVAWPGAEISVMGAEGMVGIAGAQAVPRRRAAARGQAAAGGGDPAAHRHLQGRRLGPRRRRHRSARHARGAGARARAVVEQARRAAVAQARRHAGLKGEAMFDFTDEQKMARQMLRQWADKELAPHVAKMEKGEILPYDIMRNLIDDVRHGRDGARAVQEARGCARRAGASGQERARRHAAIPALMADRVHGAVARVPGLLPGVRRVARPRRRRDHGQGHARAEAAAGRCRS